MHKTIDYTFQKIEDQSVTIEVSENWNLIKPFIPIDLPVGVHTFRLVDSRPIRGQELDPYSHEREG